MADKIGPDAELIYAHPSRCALGEGAVWDPHTQRLLWVDIVRGEDGAATCADIATGSTCKMTSQQDGDDDGEDVCACGCSGR